MSVIERENALFYRESTIKDGIMLRSLRSRPDREGKGEEQTEDFSRDISVERRLVAPRIIRENIFPRKRNFIKFLYIS